MKTILSILSSICKKCCIGLLIFLILYTLIVTLMLTFCFDFLIKIIHLTPGTIHHYDTNKNIVIIIFIIFGKILKNSLLNSLN